MSTGKTFVKLSQSCTRTRLRLGSPYPSVHHNHCQRLSRAFATQTKLLTDGVFRELTAARVQTPWIEAFEQASRGSKDASKAKSLPADRDLTPKPMSDSYHSVILPLAKDRWLLDTYANSSGHIRLGTILMDLDALSGVIAYKHTGDAVTTVTASVDRITIMHPLTEICDLELSGQVTYASGRSSIEISISVAKAPSTPGQRPEKEDIMLTCSFTMVSLDPATRKPVNVPAVLAETSEEKALYDAGARNHERRKAIQTKSLLKTAPDHNESELVHTLWQRQLQYHDPNDPLRQPSNVYFMDATRISNTQIMQPQYRNRHNFMIFGGYLLKSTFELAFTCAAAFAHERPVFVSLDPSDFKHPVPVGSVLYLTATVVYTDPPLVNQPFDAQKASEADHAPGFTRVQVRVDSKVRNVEHGETKSTGQFNYTFMVSKNVKVLPRTYTEFMMYIDARRRAQRVLDSLAQQGASSRDSQLARGLTERVTE